MTEEIQCPHWKWSHKKCLAEKPCYLEPICYGWKYFRPIREDFAVREEE